MKFSAILLLIAGWGLVPAWSQELQNWTNKQGQTIDAAFLGIDGENVQLRLDDGRKFNIPIVELSLDSQTRLRELQQDAAIAHIPSIFRKRLTAQRRAAAVASHGGDPVVLEATQKALDWFLANQNPDGSFGKEHTAAATASALLAVLGRGETPDSTMYGSLVTRAALYLLARGRDEDGFMFDGIKGNHACYEHAIATQALVELHALTGGDSSQIPMLHASLKKALKLITAGTTMDGGWAYGYSTKGDGDLSLSNWQIQALWLANRSDLPFPGVDNALKKGTDFIRSRQDAEGGFKYRSGDPRGKASLTGGALFSLRNGNQQTGGEYGLGINYLSKSFPNPTAVGSFYTPYFNTLAFFHEGGEAWKTYQGKFISRLLSAQKADGSWDSAVTSKDDGGTIGTAWGALMLEVYYRYDMD